VASGEKVPKNSTHEDAESAEAAEKRNLGLTHRRRAWGSRPLQPIRKASPLKG